MQKIQNTAPHSKVSASTCPLCGAPLIAGHPAECTKCDWVADPAPDAITHASTFRDQVAVILSIMPGLGHLYKGHKLTGVVYMLGAGLAFLTCAVAATFTAGFGILLLPLYWVATMLHAYWIEDRSIAPWAKMK